jgi:adenylate cyclase
MAEEGFKRKLTAILIADVEGYSRLMDNDEAATIRTLTSHRTAVSNLIQQYRGRVVDTTGDNLMAEFTSAVDSVKCAVEIQQELAKRNAELQDDRRMEFRIGVNIGDVVEEENRIYGDGVNIAARVEGLAEAGGICISGEVHDHVENKLDLEYEYFGEQKVKNIKRPISVYRVKFNPNIAVNRKIHAKKTASKKWYKIAYIIIPVFFLAIAALTIWKYYFRLPHVEIVSKGKIALKLPEGPSVAVLPFVNMSDDPQQDYFSDGLTENIITSLSGCPKLFVIARNSSFVYKDKPINVKKVAEEMGVRYVVEGGVQKTQDRLRITAQLIDAITGYHVWSEKYDRDLKDIFKLQDEITSNIIKALEIILMEGEQARLRYKGPGTLETFMKALKAREYIWQMNKESNVLALEIMKDIVQLVPDSSGANAGLALTYLADLWYGSESPFISMAQASKYTKKALELDDSNFDAYLALSMLYLMRKQHDQAIASAKHAITLNPNSADAYALLGFCLWTSGRYLEAIDVLKKAIRLNPMPTSNYFDSLGSSYLGLERYEEAVESFKKAVKVSPTDIFARYLLTSTYSLMGLESEARKEALEVLSIDPDFSLSYQEKIVPARDKTFVKRCIEAARKAGLPE